MPMISPDTVWGRLGRKVLIGIALFSLALGFAKCVHDLPAGRQAYPAETVAAGDKRAYDELRRQGFSDSEARKSAPAIRQLCEAGGGVDCR